MSIKIIFFTKKCSSLKRQKSRLIKATVDTMHCRLYMQQDNITTKNSACLMKIKQIMYRS